MTDTPEALMREAMRLHRQNSVPEAMSAYRSIVTRWPRYADAWYNLAVLQRQIFLYNDALDSYREALDLGISRPEEVHLNRAVIFSDMLNDPVTAARELEQALSVNPGYAPALLNLANLYEDIGKRQEASAFYARILEVEPQNHEALARFANVQNLDTVDAALIERLQRAIALAPAAHHRASLGFALGRLLDGAGRYPEAFVAYAAANHASRASAGPNFVAYDNARQQNFVDRMIEMAAPAARATESADSPQPIFILGMFRSGSTLTEQLLASLPGVAAGGELPFLPQFINTELTPFYESLQALSPQRLDAVAARYRAELKQISATARYVTDKRPDNFLYIGLIKQLFPAAKIIHTVRDPLDNCLSIYFLHLEQQMSYALDLLDTGHFFTESRRLMTHWKKQFPDDIFDFDYDALVREPQQAMRGLCDFLGLEWSGEMPAVALRSGAIKTASVWQVRQPLYRTSSGRARHYAGELRALQQYLDGAV